jgi:hypothetical protein
VLRPGPQARRARLAGRLAAAWGVLGIVALLVRAIWRLVPGALEGLGGGLSPQGWAATVAWIAAMAYFEGYRGFQRSFAPRVVARAAEIARHPRPLPALLAPLYCMSLFSAPRRRILASWALRAFHVVLILSESRIPQPARGVIDAGVVVRLGWGVAVLLALAAAGWLGSRPGPPTPTP